MPDTPPFRHAIIHEGIMGVQRGCGLTGLYCVQRPTPGQRDVSECFELPDGTKPDLDYGVRCGVCGYPMGIDVLKYLCDVVPREIRREQRLMERRN